jgi:hypothetical protein
VLIWFFSWLPAIWSLYFFTHPCVGWMIQFIMAITHGLVRMILLEWIRLEVVKGKLKPKRYTMGWYLINFDQIKFFYISISMRKNCHQIKYDPPVHFLTIFTVLFLFLLLSLDSFFQMEKNWEFFSFWAQCLFGFLMRISILPLWITLMYPICGYNNTPIFSGLLANYKRYILTAAMSIQRIVSSAL